MDESLKSSGILNRYGMQDQHTAQTLLHMARQGTLPELTVAYFPDNDFISHDYGPQQALAVLQQIDQWLGELVDIYGGVQSLLDQYCLVITGDHSQTDMESDKSASIDLSRVLVNYQIVPPGAAWENDEDLVVCPNMRAACIYLRHPHRENVEVLHLELLTDERVDQLIWQGQLFDSNDHGWYVATRDRGTIHFWCGEDGDQTGRDVYGGAWSWQGDLGAVDGYRTTEGILHFPTYPNAFERIVCAHQASEGIHLWVTARPGYEFVLPQLDTHRAGAHGSLHVLDSESPLLIAGTPENVTIPEYPRSVDIAPLCLAMLGLDPEVPMGASHV